MVAGPPRGKKTAKTQNKNHAWNRLAKLTDDSSDLIAQFRYNGLSRRIAKTDQHGWARQYYRRSLALINRYRSVRIACKVAAT